MKPDLSRQGLSTARRWADCIESMGNVTQPTLQDLGTGLVVSGPRHMDNIRHWPNLGFLVQNGSLGMYTRGIRGRAFGV